MRSFCKLTAVLTALILLLAGCSGSDTSWVAQAGEDTIAPGVYLVELMMGYNEAASKNPTAEDLLKETIDDLPAPQYITDYAKKECAKLLAIQREFTARGLELTAEDTESAGAYTDYLYQMGESFYQANGVAKESVQFINDRTMMSLAIFNDLYGEGGEREVPRAELEQAFASQYTRSQYILFPKVDSATGAPLGEEAVAAAKVKAEEYLEKAKGGENFTDLLYENAKEMDPANIQERHEDDRAYDAYLENNASYYPPVYESAILEMADNEIRLVEDDYYYYILKKLPLLEGESERIENYLSGILQTMKYDEYMEVLEDWGEELGVKYNNAALAAFSPAKLKMTQEEIEAANGAGGSSESGSEGSSVSDNGSSGSGSESSVASDNGSGAESQG